ncbi:MAG: EAL domain-containing protein [Cyanobacteria bacterium P01_A01_bin.123]
MAHSLTQSLRSLDQSPLDKASWFDLMQRAVAYASNGIVITDPTQPNNPIIYVNPAFERITGYTAEEVLNRNCRFLQGEEREQLARYQLNTAIQKKQDCHVILQNFRKDGTPFWNDLYITPIHDLEGNLTHFLGIQNDITEQKTIQDSLQRQENDLRIILQSMVDGLVVVNQDGDVIFANQAAEKLFNRPATELLGQSLGIPVTVNSQAEIDIYRPGLKPIWVDFVCNEIIWQGAPAYLISLRELTERRQVYDALTRLPNRVLFNERLQHVIDLSQRHSHCHFALLFIDLDQFKVINDSLGHRAGDQLLSRFALRIQHQLRASDMLARLSGDEFAILLEELSHIDDVTQVAERINTALTKPFALEGREVFTSASIGIALGRPDLKHPGDLIREADTAMYRAKAKGGACYAIFDQEMHYQAMLRLQLETDLRYAIERQELKVHYQPLIALTSNRLVGLEALLRWHHPQKGLISPEQFIPIAEETGLIIPIGQYVLLQACQQVESWLKQALLPFPFTISVNLSGKQLSNPQLATQILKVLSEIGLDPHYLQLEITESLLMENPTAATSIFQDLEASSIRLAMDDFGTGYSSLSYLRRFPVHTLKIDRSFTHRLGTQDEDLEIIQTIVSLAHSLKMDVIAEGVENEAQLCHLKAIGCDIGQGFLFAKALDPQNTANFLRQKQTQTA